MRTALALLVGINDYRRDELRLHCPINDATEVAKLLAEHGDGSWNFEVEVLKDVQTKALLSKNIDKLFSHNYEVCLFYFSGHGYVSENGTGYLVTPDTKQYDAGVSMDEVLHVVNQSKARNRIVIVDTCYSGAFGNPAIMGSNTTYINEGVTIMSAAQKHQVATEKGKHSLFTELLIEALKGGAADITGSITPGGIYAYIDRALGYWGQRPVFKTNISYSCCLRKVTPPIPLEVLKKIPDYFQNPDDEYPLNPSFEPTNNPEDIPKLQTPFSNIDNCKKFADLQMLRNIGLVQPVGEVHMYYAAMNSKPCKLTELGRHCRKLVVDRKI